MLRILGRVRIKSRSARTTLALASRVRSNFQMTNARQVNGLPDVCLPRFRLLKFKGLGFAERVNGQLRMTSHCLYFFRMFHVY